MPIYEYVCEACGCAFEHLARTLSDGAKKCPKCGAAKPVKQLSAFSTAECSTALPCSGGGCPAAGGDSAVSPCGGGACPL
ncbi:MAG: zinc ribbon domain-containing protein [Kiritimatiellia bacterium]|jgi:putative FmdB family regulatory protein|nr:zinc ribbon domain-containing protein [Kiritimatiellia bacterium]MDP6810078.1 zinc ribbon domain-containing protein [Kiritimatiellia bacterium]MDP7024849.1 zinc ribbon domain-containing protein [Kiritimatiellia bacterium]